MRAVFFFAAISLVLFSCNLVKDKTREAITKTGETVGRGSTEFVKGLSEGIDRTLQCKVELGSALTGKGVEAGKFRISDSGTAKNNVLTSYLIFKSDFRQDVTVKVFDQNGLEYGRVKAPVEGKAGEAKFIDFAFDKRTAIESRSRFVME